MVFLFIFYLLLLMNFDILSQDNQNKNYKIIAYYQGWSANSIDSFEPKKINASKLTHINYAFVDHNEFGKIKFINQKTDLENFKQLYNLKKKYKHLKIFITIRSHANEFSKMLKNEKYQNNFIKNCLKFCKTFGFDGIDIDWEFPKSLDDKVNFTFFLEKFYKLAHSKNLLLTIAGSASIKNLKFMEINKIHKFLDWINVMAYDFHGPWEHDDDNITHHLAPLYHNNVSSAELNIDSVINYYLNQGVPSFKLILGIPLYGRSFSKVDSTPTGLFSTYKGPGKGDPRPGIYFYSHIKEKLKHKYCSYWDDEAKYHYLYDPYGQEFVSCENEKSLIIKSEYVKNMKLAGVMFWALYNNEVMEAVEIVTNELKK